MQIRDAKIYSFGKLQQREYHFAPEINVIYGENEAGKSTLHAFLLAMLFGMDKGRGRSLKDDYQRYEPWHAPAYYSGALRFTVEGRPFYLERNFYHREKRELLRNEIDGEELSVAYGDLAVLLGGIDKETYANTYDIPQTGAVTGGELSKVLAEYLSDAAEGGGGTTHVTRAHAILTAKKKELSVELKKIQSEKEQQKSALRLEQELIEQDAKKLRNDIVSARLDLEEMNQKLAETSLRDLVGADGKNESDVSAKNSVGSGTEDGERTAIHEKKRKGTLPGIFITVIALLGLLINWKLKDAAIYSQSLSFTLQGMFLAAAVGGTFYTGYVAVKGKRSLRNEETEKQNKSAKQILAMLEENLNEKDTRLYNITEQLETLNGQEDREREIMQDISALELAESEITRIAQEFCEELEDELNSEVSRYVSAITAGKYDSVRVGEKGTLLVLTDGKEISPEALSRGTLEQFYMALRLAVGNIVMREEPMPICLDEAFALYDDRRVMQALKVLSDTGRQVLLFTCQKRELELLEKLGICYHRIDL